MSSRVLNPPSILTITASYTTNLLSIYEVEIQAHNKYSSRDEIERETREMMKGTTTKKQLSRKGQHVMQLLIVSYTSALLGPISSDHPFWLSRFQAQPHIITSSGSTSCKLGRGSASWEEEGNTIQHRKQHEDEDIKSIGKEHTSHATFQRMIKEEVGIPRSPFLMVRKSHTRIISRFPCLDPVPFFSRPMASPSLTTELNYFIATRCPFTLVLPAPGNGSTQWPFHSY